MRKLKAGLVDFVSTIGAIAALYALDSSSWTYLVLLAFGMAQKYCGIQAGRRQVLNSAVLAIISKVRA